MKALGLKSIAAIGLMAVHSHAIFGLGGHWAPALGMEVKKDKAAVLSGGGQEVILDMKGASGLNGLGVKLWIDALPFVDLQVSGNMQFSYYDVDLITPNVGGGTTTTPLRFNLGMPLLSPKPFFARTFGDASLVYPFLKIPPVVNLVKVYAGGGVSYGAATQTLSAKFAKKVLTEANISVNPPYDQLAITNALVNGIKKSGYKSGMGGFAQLGAQLKPPVIPIAAYLDFKYHFIGYNPDLVGSSSLTMELGAALAF